jgi:hypothetical protein
VKMITVLVEDKTKRELDKLRKEGWSINHFTRLALTKALRAHRRELREANGQRRA